MYVSNVITAGALLSLVAAVPMAHKRDVVWVTTTQEDIVTVDVTKTVWVDPGETPAHYGHQHHHHHHSKVTSHILSTVTVAAPSYSSPAAPVESSSESSYVAPAPSTYVAPTSTSVYVAPTSTSVYVPPPSPTSTYVPPPPSTTTSVYVPPPSSVPAPAPSSPSTGGSGLSYGQGASGTKYTGDLTYYAVGLGACGWTNTDDEAIVAVSEEIFDSYLSEAGGNPNNNPICGKYVSITCPSTGTQYSAKVVDRCPGCEQGSLDLSNSFFLNFDPLSVGRITGVDWEFQ